MSWSNREIATFGEPDLQIAQLQVWIHGREFVDAQDYWDGNWLRVTARCTSAMSMVLTHGPIIHLGEIVALERECRRLYETLQGRAGLNCIEPNLGVKLTAETGGHIRVELEITPNHLSETHRFVARIEQTHLPPIIASCARTLEKFPVREREKLLE